MNARPRQNALLLAALLCLPALAASASSRPLPPLPGRTVEELKSAEDMNKKHIVEGDDPSVDCVREVTAKDLNAARMADIQGATGNEAKNLKKCMRQDDAFRRAGEAASYLGHYYMNFTPFAGELNSMQPAERQKFHESIRLCVANDPKCTDSMKTTVLKAMVQYNFGKDLRAQVVENTARAERMKTASADLPAEFWRSNRTSAQRVMTHKGALKTGSLRTTTFRLNAKADYVFDWNTKSAAERARLGNEFMQQYRGFVDNYSKTTQQKSRWHYVTAKGAGVLGNTYKPVDDFRNLDQKTGKLAINRERHDADMRSQNTQKVNEIIHSYKESLNKESVMREQMVNGKATPVDTKWSNTDPAVVMANDLGMGLPAKQENGKDIDPKTIARGLILSINKAIVTTEETMAKRGSSARVPSSSGASAPPPKTIPSVNVDAEKFDQFLDAIWPADVAKP
jgi:hypothetical protein